MVIGLSLAGVGVLIPFVTISVHGKPHEVPGLLLYIVHALRMLPFRFPEKTPTTQSNSRPFAK